MDRPAPIIKPPHSRNDVNPDTADSTPIIISTAILELQVMVVDFCGVIPIVIGFHNKVLLETFLKSPPKFDSNIIIDDICKEIFIPINGGTIKT